MVKQCFIIFACLALGHAISWVPGINFPGSIIGLLLLTAALQMKIVKLQSVKGIADFLISNMGFFFVPPGVALMLYFDVIKAELWPIVIATVVSTVVVLISTGWTYQIIRKSDIGKKVMSLFKK